MTDGDPAFQQTFTMWAAPNQRRRSFAKLTGLAIFGVAAGGAAFAALLALLVGPGPVPDFFAWVMFLTALLVPFGALIGSGVFVILAHLFKDMVSVQIEGQVARVTRDTERLWSGHISELRTEGVDPRFSPTHLVFGDHRLDVGRVPPRVCAALQAIPRTEAGTDAEVPRELKAMRTERAP